MISEVRGKKRLKTHQTRSGPGHFGEAGRSRERSLDISGDAGTPLPELDTFLRLCVKPSPAFHIHCTHTHNLITSSSKKKKKKKSYDSNRSALITGALFPPLFQNAPKLFPWKKKKKICESLKGKLSASLLVSVSWLFRWSPAHFSLLSVSPTEPNPSYKLQ